MRMQDGCYIPVHIKKRSWLSFQIRRPKLIYNLYLQLKQCNFTKQPSFIQMLKALWLSTRYMG